MNGFLNIIKPPDMTSSDVVVKVRRRLRELSGKKDITVGHLGTLDPAAEGVLVIAVGAAAKLFDFFIGKKKLYRAEFVFGQTTDTLDRDGEITEWGGSIPLLSQLQEAARRLTGEIMQIPPSYSAKSVDGVRAYERMRRGENVELPPKRVTVNRIEIISYDAPKAIITVDCLGGVYIRSIARDMADICGTYAYMSALTRLSAGAFEIKDGISLEDFLAADDINLLPVEYPLGDFTRFDVDARFLEKLKNGVRLRPDGMPEGDFVVRCGGALFGIGSKNSDGELVVSVRLIGRE